MVSCARVLLIEDDSALREGVSLALRHQGYEVRAVATGEEAVVRLAEHPDVAVLDVMLPGIDGFETCRRIRTAGNLPVIMLTARGDDIDVVAGLEAGADDLRGEAGATPSARPVRPAMSDVRSEPGGARAGRGFGLRSRLVVAFVAVAALTAAVTFTLTLSYSTIYTLHAGFPYWRESVKQRREIFRHSWFPIVSGGEIAVYVVVAAVVLVVLIGVVCWVATRRVLSPVRQLAVAADRLAGGDLGVRLRPVGGDELAQLVGRFNSMAGSLERSVEELSEMEYRARRFAGDVTHELRTPLAAMVAVTDVLDEHAVAIAGDGGRAARLVSDEIRNLNRLVETLIEVSRFDAGTAGLVVDDLDVAAAVERCLAARGWAGSVVVDVPAGLRGELDSRRFDVIVANLVANAASHGRPPVIVWARTESSDDGMCLTVGVRDHGPGIPVGVLPHVFERFYKADSARGRSAGSGLGLAIARENARLHGGDIRAENLPDGGAVFLVTLPLPLPLPRLAPDCYQTVTSS